jgi:hypothetical protein
MRFLRYEIKGPYIEIHVKSIKFGVIEIRGGLTGESGPSGLPY